MKSGLSTDSRHCARPWLMIMVLLLQSAVAIQWRRDGWKPDSERTGTAFRLGDAKGQGVKVVGYQGEWPLWSDFRAQQDKLAHSTSTTAQPTAGTDAVFVCMPVDDCIACPDDLLHFPYCRPYNNRQRVACQQVSHPSDPASIQLALAQAPLSSTTGWQACGKSPKAEARDYLQLIAWMAGIALGSIYLFVRRQKVLFEQQESRVSGHRRRATLYN